jgi:RNA recognition motif-containing protein
MFDEDPEALENHPDNSHLECNICVTGLDESLTSENLHKMFARFGEIKSCKVASDPVTGKSKGYGYVWFTTERACKSAL